MRDRQTCIDCGKKSPETETNYTLISAQFGWRLTRRREPNGDFVVEWRCPDCWRAHKKRLDEAPSSAQGTQGKSIPDRAPPTPPTPAPPRPSRGSKPPSARASSKPPPASSPPEAPATSRFRRS
jgi:hypothetical protein